MNLMKFKHGSIGTMDGVWHDIIVKATMPNKCKDILIGGGVVVAGIAYLTTTAFKHGADAFELAEFNTMKDAGLIGSPHDTPDGLKAHADASKYRRG